MNREPRQEKVEAVEKLRSGFEQSKSTILTDYRGMNVAAMTKLRRNMRQAGVEYKVVKNTLAKIALHDLGITGLDLFFEGPTAIAMSKTDPVAPAKIISDFIRETRDTSLQVKAGLLNREFIDEAGIRALADLPSREQLLARVAGCFASPLSSMASVLSAPLRNVGYALQEILKRKEEQALAAG